jgi:antirestriction protein ArdC
MDSNTSTSPKVDVYAIVTNRIIELLEQGTVPWQKPWTDTGIPMNVLSKRPYRGINLWLLLSLNYEHNLFLTWDQLKKLGGSVKQGEHGHVVIFWKTAQKNTDEDAEKEKKAPLLRYYKVFNIAQCRDMPPELVEPVTPKELNPIHECEAIINGMPQSPTIRHKEKLAFYHSAEDYINMPQRKLFKQKEHYYATLFHELVHSTGHEKRLNRKSITEMAEFGSELYSLEELVAEVGSAYLSAFTGILNSGIKNSAAYINGWLGKLRNDKRLIVQASGLAQRAVDFIINQPVSTSDTKEEVEQSELLTDN